MRKQRVLWLRRFLLWLAVGPRTYDYMARVLRSDPRLRVCKLADIVVRQDGRERRIEADWLKSLATIVMGRWRPAMVTKRGPFTWVGDVSAWLEQLANSHVPPPAEVANCEQENIRKSAE